MFTYLFDHDDFELIAGQTENQPIETAQVNGILPASITLECMTAQTGQSHQLIDVLGALNNVNPLNVFAGNLFTKQLTSLPMPMKTGF